MTSTYDRCPECLRPLKMRIKIGGNLLVPHHKPSVGGTGARYVTGWCAGGAKEITPVRTGSAEEER